MSFDDIFEPVNDMFEEEKDSQCMENNIVTGVKGVWNTGTPDKKVWNTGNPDKKIWNNISKDDNLGKAWITGKNEYFSI